MSNLKLKLMASIIESVQSDNSAPTKQRRNIAALSTLGVVDFSIISLYQIGFIKSLPDLPGKILILTVSMPPKMPSFSAYRMAQ